MAVELAPELSTTRFSFVVSLAGLVTRAGGPRLLRLLAFLLLLLLLMLPPSASFLSPLTSPNPFSRPSAQPVLPGGLGDL